MKQDGKYFYGWTIVIGGILIIMFAIPLVNTLGSLFMIPVTTELGIDRTQFAVTGTIVSVMTIIMSPIAGKIYNSHKFKMRTVQTTALLVLALAYGSYSFAHSTTQLYISAFFMGLAFIAAGMMPISGMINNWFVKKRGLAMSFAMIGISLGPTLLAVPINMLIQTYDWRTARIIIMVVMLVICLPISFFVMKEKPEDIGQRPYGGDEALKEKQEAAKRAGKDAKMTLENNIPLKHAKVYLFFWILCAGMLFNGFLAGGSIQHYNPFFTDNFGPATAAWLVSLGSMMGIIGKLLVGIIFDKFGNKKSMIIGTLCGTIVFLIFAFLGNSLYAVVGATFLDGIGSSLQTLGINLLITAIFGTVNYAEIFGVMKMSQQAGMATGAIVLAVIFDTLGSYQLAWMACAVLMLLFGLSIVFADYKSNKVNAEIQLKIAAENESKQSA